MPSNENERMAMPICVGETMEQCTDRERESPPFPWWFLEVDVAGESRYDMTQASHHYRIEH